MKTQGMDGGPNFQRTQGLWCEKQDLAGTSLNEGGLRVDSKEVQGHFNKTDMAEGVRGF
jgi:hypothetical protein